jgi:hypothetical protein
MEQKMNPILTRLALMANPICVKELAKLIGKSESTVRTCASSSNPEIRKYIPVPHHLPFSRKLWFSHASIIEWLAQGDGGRGGMRRGASTKSERLEAARRGISVKNLRSA